MITQTLLWWWAGSIHYQWRKFSKTAQRTMFCTIVFVLCYLAKFSKLAHFYFVLSCLALFCLRVVFSSYFLALSGRFLQIVEIKVGTIDIFVPCSVWFRKHCIIHMILFYVYQNEQGTKIMKNLQFWNSKVGNTKWKQKMRFRFLPATLKQKIRFHFLPVPSSPPDRMVWKKNHEPMGPEVTWLSLFIFCVEKSQFW